MRYFLALAFALLPCLASADDIDSWVASSVIRKVVATRQVCYGPGDCRQVPIYGYVGVRQIESAPSLFNFASYSTIAGGPPLLPASAFSNAPATVVSVGQPQIVSVSPPVVTSSTCNCSVTGICLCDPATCSCESCANGRARMGLAPAVQYATGNSYYSVANPTAAERIIYSSTGHVHVFTDPETGMVSTSHSGGRIQRVVARQERWRARKGVQ